MLPAESPPARVVHPDLFASKVASYVQAKLEASGFDVGSFQRVGYVEILACHRRGPKALEVHVRPGPREVAATLLFPHEAEALARGETAGRTFRLPVGERFHAFGGALGSAIEGALAVDEPAPLRPGIGHPADAGALAAALRAAFDEDPDGAAERVAAALEETCRGEDLEAFLEALRGAAPAPGSPR